MFRLSIFTGKLVVSVLHLFGRGGSALPGLIVEKLNPRFLDSLPSRLSSGVILVTGSNGKTTTTKILTAIHKASGLRVLTNRTGSNFRRGIIAATLEYADWSGSLDADIAVLEVDEGHAPMLSEKLKPKLLLALNVFRDQLDRYGELDTTAAKIEKAAQFADHVVVNSDDPSFAALRSAVPSNKLSTFGATPDIQQLLPHDAMLHHQDTVVTDNKPDSLLSEVKVIAKDDSQVLTIKQSEIAHTVTTKLGGAYNAINITAVLEAARILACNKDTVVSTITTVDPAFGRGEVIHWQGKPVLLQLVKNPAGFNQIIHSLHTVRNECLVILINDQIADGRDVSWLWDVSIKDIKEWAHTPSQVMTGGTRAYDMAVRLKYENIQSSPETDLSKVLYQLKKQSKRITIVATYTAMLEIRALLVKQSSAKEFWK